MPKAKKKNRPKVSVPNHNYRWPLLGVILLTIFVFAPALDGDFVNWDDETYIEENRTIQKLDLDNIREMFKTDRTLIGNYHPLTELSFAINFALFNVDPKGYIGTNILLHILNTILVFFFFYRFSEKNVIISIITSLLFAIHPMHVESVCWISERKDVLYVFFYLIAMNTYLSFLRLGKKRYYVLTLVLFLLALLSKAQAVTLPLVLFLLHYWFEKSRIKTVLINLGPFLITAFLFGLQAINSQNEALTMVDLGLMDRIVVSNLGLVTYLLKSVFPFKLSALHPYPEAMEWPTYYYGLPVVGLVFLWLLIWSYRNNRMTFFGGSFFILTVFPVLQFLPVGMSMHAERYSYLPYIGLFFIMASTYSYVSGDRFWLKSKPHLSLIMAVGIAIFAGIAFNRTKVWNTSESLWLDVIKKYPHNFVAYVNITNHYIFENELDKAIEYADRGIKTVGHNVYFYDNKAYSLIMAHKYQEALEVIETAKKVAEPDAQLFVNEGDSYLGLHLPEQAISSYTLALRINPGHPIALIKRANTLLNYLNDPSSAIRDLQTALQIDPHQIEALTSLAAAYHQTGNKQEAMFILERAMVLDPFNMALKELKLVFEQN